MIHLMNIQPEDCICSPKSSVDHLWLTTISLVKAFGLDSSMDNRRRQVMNALFSVSYPTPLDKNPKLAGASEDALLNILDSKGIHKEERFLKMLSGELTLLKPVSHRYGGYQFGYWAGQLGDGRAHILGSYRNKKGEIWELQLKGSGQTPFSRDGDGRAVLRSSVREFLASEAMYHLGVPTSRAVALIVSDDKATRDQFYNGNIQRERCAVVLRLAQSWLRFGSFDLMHLNGEVKLMRNIIDHTLQNFFKHINTSSEDRFVQFLWEATDLTARLIAKWSSIGFAHGVINTDNLSILGITIDYGPFGFVESYDPRFIPNTSDDEGRYRLENQANAAVFNLQRLSEALVNLHDHRSHYVGQLRSVVNQFGKLYQSYLMNEFASKLGFSKIPKDLDYLVALLLHIMEEQKGDFTMTFRELSEISLKILKESELPAHFWALNIVVKHKMFPEFLSIYQRALRENSVNENERQLLMINSNPRYILRNWIAEKAIVAAEKNDFSILQSLERIYRNPYRRQEEAEALGMASPAPNWAKSLRVSCSS